MAYLRTIVGRHGRRVHKSSCSGCAAVLYRFEHFCPACGAINARFDASVFQRFARTTLSQALASCLRDPGHTFERGNPAGGQDSLIADRFCSVCGVEVPQDLTVD